jgi:hypothetical protein
MAADVVLEQSAEREIQVPQFYINGFSINISNADVGLLMLLNNQPVGVLNLSFSTAKTLAKSLDTLIGNLERASGHEIMDIGYLGKVVSDMQKGSGDGQ